MEMCDRGSVQDAMEQNVFALDDGGRVGGLDMDLVVMTLAEIAGAMDFLHQVSGICSVLNVHSHMSGVGGQLLPLLCGCPPDAMTGKGKGLSFSLVRRCLDLMYRHDVRSFPRPCNSTVSRTGISSPRTCC